MLVFLLSLLPFPPANPYVYFKVQCQWSRDVPSTLRIGPHTSKWWHTGSGPAALLSSLLTRWMYSWYWNKNSCLIRQCLANLIFSFPVRPFALVYPPAKWVHHVVRAAPGRGRVLTHSSSGQFFHQPAGILSQAHPGWPSGPLPVRWGWRHLPWLPQPHQDSWEDLSS